MLTQLNFYFPGTYSTFGSLTDRHSLFTPRHEFFRINAGALRENCFCPIPCVAYSEIRPLCAILALVSGKRPALVQSSSRSTCAPVPGLSFIVDLGDGALSLGVATLAPDEDARIGCQSLKLRSSGIPRVELKHWDSLSSGSDIFRSLHRNQSVYSESRKTGILEILSSPMGVPNSLASVDATDAEPVR